VAGDELVATAEVATVFLGRTEAGEGVISSGGMDGDGCALELTSSREASGGGGTLSILACDSRAADFSTAGSVRGV
jgi:hypothetical protein